MSKVQKSLKYYQSELSDTLSSFYAWKYINDLAVEDKATLAALNLNAFSWTTFMRSLQCMFFISLGRIFDTDSKAFSIHKLLDACGNNIDEFSKDSLRARKTNGGLKPDVLEEYMTDTYEATQKDFEEIKCEVEKWNNTYIKKYQRIRHKIFAHKENKFIGKSDSLFANTNIDEIEEMLSFLNSVERFIFELFHNGRKRSLTDCAAAPDIKDRVLGDLKSLMTLIKKGHSASTAH